MFTNWVAVYINRWGVLDYLTFKGTYTWEEAEQYARSKIDSRVDAFKLFASKSEIR